MIRFIAVAVLCNLFLKSYTFANDENNPWFLGSEPIPYCVETAPDFPFTSAHVKKIISKSFLKWKKFFQYYKFNDHAFPGHFHDGIERRITIDAIELLSCDNNKHQLRFKIGVADNEVSEYFETHDRYVVGFNYNGNYDHKTFRSGGIIWIAPNWRSVSAFEQIIDHEIGKVLGLPPLPCTEMGNHVPAGIFQPTECRHGGWLLSGEKPLQKLMSSSDSFSVEIQDRDDTSTGLDLLRKFGHTDYQDDRFWGHTIYTISSCGERKVCFELAVTTEQGKEYRAKGTESKYSAIESGNSQIRFSSPNYIEVKNSERIHEHLIYDFSYQYFKSKGKIQIGNETQNYLLISQGNIQLIRWVGPWEQIYPPDTQTGLLTDRF